MKNSLFVLLVLLLLICNNSYAGEKTILEKVWDNATSQYPLEIAKGRYKNTLGIRDLIIARSAGIMNGRKEERMRADFMDTKGNRILRIANPDIVFQFIRHANDSNRIRIYYPTATESLMGTVIPPFLLTIHHHLIMVYGIAEEKKLKNGTIKIRVVQRGKKDNKIYGSMVPESLELLVEERNGLYAPIQLECFVGLVKIYTISYTNGYVYGKLRPFRLEVTSYNEDTPSIILFDVWYSAGTMLYLDPTSEFYKEISVPNGARPTFRPPEIGF